MTIISSKIRLDAMSKVISFSISDRYLDKLRSLYPALTDNLAAKQFLTDRLDSSLGNSLDGSLDDGLDGKLKTLIESELNGLLDERLDAVVGKSLTSLSERLSRLEERLDGSLDGRLDDMELLPKEALRLDHLDDQKLIDAIESQLEDTEIDESDYEPDSTDKPVTDAIGPVTGDSSPIESVTGEAVDIGNRQGLTNAQLHKKTCVPVSTIEKWKGKMKVGEPIVSKRYPDFFKQWSLNLDDSLWYEVD